MSPRLRLLSYLYMITVVASLFIWLCVVPMFDNFDNSRMKCSKATKLGFAIVVLYIFCTTLVNVLKKMQ